MFNPAQHDVKYIFILVKTGLYSVDSNYPEVNHLDFLALLHVHVKFGQRDNAVVGRGSSSHCSWVLFPLKINRIRLQLLPFSKEASKSAFLTLRDSASTLEQNHSTYSGFAQLLVISYIP